MITPNALKVAPSSLQEEIHLFLEERNILGIHVSQQIRTLEQLDPKQKIFVGTRLGPVPSGFLILRSDSPVIYWNTKIGSAHILRISLDRRQLEKIGSAVISATYYASERKLILEDVLYYNNNIVYNDKTFLERWELMNRLCKFVIKPDISGIQGFELTVAKYMSLSEWLAQGTLQGYMSEFVFDKPHWRRLLWRGDVIQGQLPQGQGQSQQHQKQYKTLPLLPTPQVHVHTQQPKMDAIITPTITTTSLEPHELIATIEKDTSLNLPDSYVLYAAGHKLIGAASVRKLTISLALRSAIISTTPITVRVEYNESFKKYEVVEVLDSSQVQVAPVESFERKT
jgi:hypothetical protein